MKESDLNTIIVNSFKANNYYAYKIVDPSSADVFTTSKRPFDIFAETKENVYHIETKLIKSWKAFNFKVIKSHQLENLLFLRKLNQDRKSLIVLGVWIPYRNFCLFLFDILFITKLIGEGKKSILKKELLDYRKKNMFLNINKKIIETGDNFDREFCRKIIY